MENQTRCEHENATSVAARILAAYRTGSDADLRRELARTQMLPRSMRESDAFEAEKRELLNGVIESLDSPRPERVSAAIQLLEHLAKDAVIVLTR